ncbi:MAG: hypothetical protein ACK4F0_08565, partial [Candidatus Ratteibacteria bacterium]
MGIRKKEMEKVEGMEKVKEMDKKEVEKVEEIEKKEIEKVEEKKETAEGLFSEKPSEKVQEEKILSEKKKRGRKPKVKQDLNTENKVPLEKKKRGRKPKIVPPNTSSFSNKEEVKTSWSRRVSNEIARSPKQVDNFATLDEETGKKNVQRNK